MNQKRLVVFGYSDVGHACLKFLIEHGENIVHVYTHRDKPGEKIWFPSVQKCATENNISFTLDADLKSDDALKKFKDLRPDLIFSFYYRNMIPGSILETAPLGAFNMHGSLLPKFRGRAPINWAVLKGETQTGPTLHVMVEKPDAGDIIDQEVVMIGPNDTAGQVQSRVSQAAVHILERKIEALKSGDAPRRPQNNSESTYFGGRKPEDGKIDWTQSASSIHNLIRAVTHPYPGAFTDIFGKKTYIWASQLPQRKASHRSPGEIISERNHLFVVCGHETMLEILRLQNEGESEINGGELLKEKI